MRRALVMLGLLLALASPARAQGVDLLLVLDVDASGSVSAGRFDLQKQGYAAAFRAPEVQAAIASGPRQAIAVTMVQWTGPAMQVQVVPWTAIRDAAGAGAVADAIDATRRELFGGGTSISGAIDHAMTMFAMAPFQAPRRVIDVSGDGANNRGRPSGDARDAAVAQGVVINGLPILNVEPNLAEAYRDEVIGGPGAFVLPVDSYEAFAPAILRKMVTEIAAVPPAGRTAGR
jgi:hypothetical protein